MKHFIILLSFVIVVNFAFGQKTEHTYLGRPIESDSLTTILIPVIYNTDILSSNKMVLWNDYYANIIFYNYKTDSCYKLFDSNTYIASANFDNFKQYKANKNYNNISSQWIFYRVKNYDRNKNGRIDDNDPFILYISDLQGHNLKKITSEEGNVVDIEIFEKQGFALIRMQKDSNNDLNFKSNDKEFYYVRLNLTTLKLEGKIEL